MVTHVFALVAALVAASQVAPSGTYNYVVFAQGKKTATSTIVIDRTPSAVTIKETVDAGGQSMSTTRTLDPATLSTLQWTGGPPAETMTVTANGATYARHDGAPETAVAPAGAAFPSSVFDLFVGEFVAMPAMIHLTNATKYNEYCVCMGPLQAKAITVLPATAARPPGAHAGDEAIQLQSGDASATLWYDPETFILRDLELPKDNISYVRI